MSVGIRSVRPTDATPGFALMRRVSCSASFGARDLVRRQMTGARCGEATGRRAAIALIALKAALARHQATSSPAALDEAFAAAAQAVASLRGARAVDPLDTAEVRSLLARLPDLQRLVDVAVGEAQHSAHSGAVRLWAWFGLRSAPPTWNEAERDKARVLLAFASCERHSPQQLRRRLLALASRRWASLLADELSVAGEELWRAALAERYDSVRRRCAPRTRLRMRELCDLLGPGYRPRAALQERLAGWLAAGCDFRRLALELEAAIVQTRTPDVIA